MKKSGISLIIASSIWIVLLVWQLFTWREFNAEFILRILPPLGLLVAGILMCQPIDNPLQRPSRTVGIIISISGLVMLCANIYTWGIYLEWSITLLNIFWLLPSLGTMTTGFLMLSRGSNENPVSYKLPGVILLIAACIWVCLESYAIIDGLINEYIWGIQPYLWVVIPINVLLAGIFMIQGPTSIKIDLAPPKVNNEPVTVSDWLLTYFLLSLPVINLIMLFVWAFNQSEKQSKSNWAKAFLIWTLIVSFIYLLIIALVALSM